MTQPQKVSKMSLSDSGACYPGFPAGQALVLRARDWMILCKMCRGLGPGQGLLHSKHTICDLGKVE